MTARSAHGTGSPALLRVETLPADEQPTGLPADSGDVSRHPIPPDGRFAVDDPRTRALASLGGTRRAGKTRLATRVSLATLGAGDAFSPYQRAAVSFRRAQCAELARTVGGGVCGPGPSSIVASAALALAWSRYLSDLAASTDDTELAIRAVRMGDSSRQALLTAHELCAREATARAATSAPSDAPWLARDDEEPAP